MIWNELSRPFTVLAPMEGFTDAVFRTLLVRWGRPDLFFTEFVRVDRVHESRRLVYHRTERPIIAQVWGSRPGEFRTAATVVEALGYQGIDINMGCPVKKIMKVQGGAGLIGRYDLVADIFGTIRDASGLPVSVKTRLGGDSTRSEEWFRFLLSLHPSALTVHGRSVEQLYGGIADWREIRKVVKLRDRVSPETRVVGNGDVRTLHHARRLSVQTGVDGVMIGRGALINPLVFTDFPDPGPAQRLSMLRDHYCLFLKYWGETKSFITLRKFFPYYFRGFRGAHSALQRAYRAQNAEELDRLIGDLEI